MKAIRILLLLSSVVPFVIHAHPLQEHLAVHTIEGVITKTLTYRDGGVSVRIESNGKQYELPVVNRQGRIKSQGDVEKVGNYIRVTYEGIPRLNGGNYWLLATNIVQIKKLATRKPLSVDDEALAAVKDLWNQHTTQCGDSYYSRNDFRGVITFNQYKNVSFIPKRRGPTSEADRLNGILWNGEVEILDRLYRRNYEGRWADWKQRTPGGGYPITATKRQSGWSVLQLMEVTNQQRVKCSEVPG